MNTRTLLLLLPMACITAGTVLACGVYDRDPLHVEPDPDPLPQRGPPPSGDAGPVASLRDDGAHAPTSSPPADSPPPLPAPPCALDTRTVYLEAGRKIESMTAYGQYWCRELFADGSFREALGFPGPVASEPKFASGPCNGMTSCTLDARTVYFDGAMKVESTIANGRLHAWTFDQNGSPVSLPGYPQVLATTPALRAGPCSASPDACRLDTRVVWDEGGVKRESITAYGKVWTFVLGPNGSRSPSKPNGAPLESVPRWALGPCLGQETACTFDTRAFYVDGDGIRHEEVTARGRLWSWLLGPNDALVATLANGTPLVDIPRFGPVCPP